MSVDVSELIAKARARLESVEPTILKVALGDDDFTVEFRPLSGPAWRDFTAVHPVRPGSALDVQLGYNVDSACKAFPSATVLKDGEPVTVGDQPLTWVDFYDLLDGPTLKAAAAAVWGLHEFDPQKRASAAGKASAGGRQKKRNSPANSASQSES